MSDSLRTKVDFSSGDLPARTAEDSAMPPLPRIWLGYLLGVATMIAEFVAVSLHPEITKPPDWAKGEFPVPPLYLFLTGFVGGVYWLACIYRIHAVLARVPGWKHPISPARAAGFHLIPFYSFYWIFKWPQEIARFVNSRLRRPLMKTVTIGVAILLALVMHVLDSGFGLILMFLPLSYVAQCVKQALAEPSAPSHNLPVSPE
jgi:hypothetical protein